MSEIRQILRRRELSDIMMISGGVKVLSFMSAIFFEFWISMILGASTVNVLISVLSTFIYFYLLLSTFYLLFFHLLKFSRHFKISLPKSVSKLKKSKIHQKIIQNIHFNHFFIPSILSVFTNFGQNMAKKSSKQLFLYFYTSFKQVSYHISTF